ncbi:DUF637 domain-containing protein [Larsenimonas rhizosphaerae]|uniref:DUF637 domain-containing protein n=1 Tax=Larsenimonas rhizosphaerae TaxID=2944682 RepID=UPI0020333850|nr:DUF637 domain-containing protein [Larsenimonas rhizosphaerae]MCM2131780.1 DUF637 domain-containing protein [Larsenimonas rhizosphaerae]
MAAGVAGSLAGTAAVSVINNRGNLGDTFDDTLSSDSLKGAALAAATAAASSWLDDAMNTSSNSVIDKTSLDGVLKFVGRRAAQAGTDAALETAIQGGSFSDAVTHNLEGALATAFQAELFNQIGDLGERYPEFLADGGSGKIVLHALAAEATGSDFRSGAIAAGANEALVTQLAALVDNDRTLLVSASKITGILAAGMADGDIEKGAEVAGNATAYNHLRHGEVQALSDELDACKEGGNCSSEDIDEILATYEKLSAENASAIADCNSRSCVEDIRSQLIGFNDPAAKNIFDTVNYYFAYDVASLLQGDPSRLVGEDQTLGNHQSNRGIFLPINDLAQTKILQEGWLSGSEKLKLKEWNENTSYLNKLAGRELSLEEKVKFSGELASLAAMTIGGISKSNSSSQGAVGNKKITSVIANEATNNNAHAALKAKLSGLQKAQKNAAYEKTLPDGRKRYYMEETPAQPKARHVALFL